jgi:hypothetical protein
MSHPATERPPAFLYVWMWALCHRDEHDRIQLLPGPIAEGWGGTPEQIIEGIEFLVKEKRIQPCPIVNTYQIVMKPL